MGRIVSDVRVPDVGYSDADMERVPLSFFFKGMAALAVLFLVTLLMEPRPEVNYVRALIGVGFAVIVLKIVLRQFNIDFPPRRHR